MKLKFSFKRSNKIAFFLYLLGFKYHCSSFEDLITHGYGDMDDFGFFKYPLVK